MVNQSEITPLLISHGKCNNNNTSYNNSNSSNNNNNKNKKIVVYYSEERHKGIIIDNSQKAKVSKWRLKDRLQTTHVALVLCLHLGIDPPDVLKPNPCSRLETWLDPTQMKTQQAMELIGNRVQEQYERWQLKGLARFKQSLDPTTEEIKKITMSLRYKAKDNRVLFHYNGHGVPKPSSNGEIWVFNKEKTQYIPLSISYLQAWVGSPSIYVFDCHSAGTVLHWFKNFAAQRENNELQDCILLGACSTNEILPMSPEYPADLFTSCLTTPIKTALRWFCTHSTILNRINKREMIDLIDKIPGHFSNRHSPIGELEWIFTSITDSIAWSILPTALFQKLFRHDLMVASLFRNYLLAERIMKAASCTPVSSPVLPSTHMHPMWQVWDLVVDICLLQLPYMLANPNYEFKRSTFFVEQLTAFEVWLESGTEHKPRQEQLPILLQALLSQDHRLRALILLGKFLDLGPWAVNMALSVGFFPYVKRMLKTASVELRQIMIFIWAKILALDKACQIDLVQDNSHYYFIEVLLTADVPPDQRAMATFVLTVVINNCRPGQSSCLSGNLLSICLQQIADPDPVVRRWMVICLGKLWENYEEAKTAAVRLGAPEKLIGMLHDVEPEVRAAAVYALGTFIGGAEGNELRTGIEINIGLTLPLVTDDASPLVRRESVITLSHLVSEYEENFKVVAKEYAQEERLRTSKGIQQEEADKKKKSSKLRSNKKDSLPSPEPITPVNTNQFSAKLGSVYGLLWKLILQLCSDPCPEVSPLANEVAHTITVQIQYTPILAAKPGPGSPSINLSPKKNGANKSKLGHQRLGNTSPSPLRLEPADEDTSSLTQSQGTYANGNTGLFKRRFSSQIGYGNDDYLTSSFYEWGASFYSKPIIAEPEDPNLPAEHRWRRERNDRVLREAWELYSPASGGQLDTQVAILDNEREGVGIVQFHPFDSLVVVADNADALSIWNWEVGLNLHMFSNNNPVSSRISSVKIINEYDRGLLLVGSSDGVIRVWDGVENAETLRLVSAWRGLPESPSATNLVMDWKQDQGRLLVAGDSGFVRVWDADREQSIMDIGCDIGVTSISSASNNNSMMNLFVTGCKDGSVRLFDMRVQASVAKYTDQSWIIGVAMPRVRDNMIVSCSTKGDIKLWDVGYSTPVLEVSTNEPATALAVHEFAPVLACGSQSQKIRVINFNGVELSNIRYHDSFLGQRIGPVSCLHFHPYKMYLAAGATDSIVSIYK